MFPVALKAAAPATHSELYKKTFFSKKFFIILSRDMENIPNTVKYLEDFGLLTKSIIKKTKNEEKEQKYELLCFF